LELSQGQIILSGVKVANAFFVGLHSRVAARYAHGYQKRYQQRRQRINFHKGQPEKIGLSANINTFRRDLLLTITNGFY
jgi:hypothetical protein